MCMSDMNVIQRILQMFCDVKKWMKEAFGFSPPHLYVSIACRPKSSKLEWAAAHSQPYPANLGLGSLKHKSNHTWIHSLVDG